MSLDGGTTAPTSKFAHTRAFLAALGREYGPKSSVVATAKSISDTSDSEAESDLSPQRETTDTGANDPTGTDDSDSLLARVIQLLDDEDDEGVKSLLRNTFDIADDTTLEQSALDLMHKRRDDQANVPFLFLTPIKRPSRPTSRTSFHSYRPSRPGTPVLTPSSPLAQGFRRPSTPLANSQSFNAPSSYSPSSSPVPAAALPNPIGSPSSSPRFLNAKATEFRPGMPRTLSSNSIIRGTSPSPAADLWAHNFAPSPTLSNASLGVGRGSSNLAIAAPLLPDHSYSPSGSTGDLLETGSGGTRTPPILIRQKGLESHAQQQQATMPAFLDDEDEDDDPFSPFVVKPIVSPVPPLVRNSTSPSHVALQGRASSADEWSDTSSPSNSFDAPPPHPPSGVGVGTDDYYRGLSSPNLQRHMRPGYFSSESSSSLNATAAPYTPSSTASYSPLRHQDSLGNMDHMMSDVVFAEQDMTPFEVLTSVFGSSVSPALLQEALDQSGYDFDAAMAWLVDQALPPPPPGLLQHRGMGGMLGYTGGVIVVGGREGANAGLSGGRLGNNPNGRNRYHQNGGQHSGQGAGQMSSNGKNHAGNRVCRYFLQGECRRADCRFSHDIDRALCRFWLRGQCAKGDNCEFLHSLPQHIDVQGFNSAMSRVDINDNEHQYHDQQRGFDFPTLGQAESRNVRRSGPQHDPTRTRWAAAAKKAPNPTTPLLSRSSGATADDGIIGRVTGGPRSSPRIRLRPPSLLPSLPTGESINKLYMAYRSQALELGAARNACLTKAAEAWRRGDGAGAKRHSREAHDLNTKMGLETGKAAAKLVRERARVAVEAVRTRDSSWSDDPNDRSEKGKLCGGSLGVCMGVASVNATGAVGGGIDKRASAEERTECLLDLHGLHSGEAVEVVEDFLVALELEHFFGLAYLLIGEEKHTGIQDSARGASRARLAAGVRDWLIKWGYPWLERDGVICVDPLTHSQ